MAARVCTSLVFLRHPVFAGIVWWLLGGPPEVAIPAAIFFELIWLDLFYVGTYVPPLALLPYLVYLPLCVIFGLASPQESVLLLVLCLPLASLGAKVENRLRLRQGEDYHSIMDAIDCGGDIAKSLKRGVYGALFRQSAVFGGLHLLSSAVLFGVVWLFAHFGVWPMGKPPLEPVAEVWSMPAQWGLLWTIAAVGGLLALRIRWAQASFIAGVIALAVFWAL